jgi:dipeptidyl aminopeptidase/acylaminoacyl peptidase
MTNKKQAAPGGTWTSPISAAAVAAGAAPLAQMALDGDRLYWLEGRPSEGGRITLMSQAGEITPAPFNVRTRVHEYGGGAYHVSGGKAWFVHIADGSIYQADAGGARPITTPGKMRFADFVHDAGRARLLSVREDHSGTGYPVNTLVAIALDDGAETVIASGADFYSSPRLSPNGKQLAWLLWNHPRMPWQGTELWLADLDAAGMPANPRMVAGGPDESVTQPEWSPDGVLHFVSDRTGWWNLYRLEAAGARALCPRAAEFGMPQWVFGMSLYGFRSASTIACSYIENGVSRLAQLDIASGKLTPLATPYEEIREVRASAGKIALMGGGPALPLEVSLLDPNSGKLEVLARSVARLPPAGYLSTPETISFPVAASKLSHAFHYPPANADYELEGKPPLIVIGHGGPTGMATSTLNVKIQYWTSRGFAVLDVNYRGSTGFGREYRDALKGQWGMVDVEDCVEGARYLAKRGLVDPQRLIIRGGSAGGYTALSALIFHDVFKMGACYYGVSDLKSLDQDSHKFEARYNEYLIAPAGQADEVYLQRSPIHHADRLRRPMIFFQGTEDQVVPPQQSELMVEALRRNGVPVEYITLEGEGHGFRKAESIVATLEAELQFYLKTFGPA